MDSDKLKRLREAGVWPEELFGLDGGGWILSGPVVKWNIPDRCVRALLIDKMMDELPLQWYMKPVESEAPDPDHGRRWRVDSHRIVDRFLPSYPDKFEALFQALVVSGRVK